MHKETVEGIYTLVCADDPLPLVFDSPHSGIIYPADFEYACDFGLLEKAEDKYVDKLFSDAPDYGAALLCADFPRSYIDVNRCIHDIDAELLEDEWPGEINTAGRSHAGIGLIRRLVRPGVPLYNKMLKAVEIQHRIEKFYHPYHNKLMELINGAHYRHGQSWHINCHSMPTQERNSFRASPLKDHDFVLGDRDGTTCDLQFVHAVRDHLKKRGFKVAINDPYKGVELVKKFSCPAQGRHSLQIEIARRLYLDEETYKKSKNFNALKEEINLLIKFCASYVSDHSLLQAAD